MKRIIALLITLGFAALGLWALAAAFPSDAQVAQESTDKIASYRPVCDHKEMGPRDTCLRFGGNAKSQTYQEMVDQYNQENSPEGLRGRYDTRKWLGVGLLVVGLGGLALVVRSFVRRRTPPPSSPLDGAGGQPVDQVPLEH
ncbi:MAG: hypothetical protein AUG44_29250 [Actinobacteria bacterium 13_1_20CM_3_71_11]|nr:MAG: hypothetical protein AUG44_29250 [Actinobacteria bacterium 13_1_20CM_3_71_11]